MALNLARVVRYVRKFNFDFHKVKEIDGKLYVSQEQLDFFKKCVISQIVNQIDNEAQKVRRAKESEAAN